MKLVIITYGTMVSHVAHTIKVCYVHMLKFSIVYSQKYLWSIYMYMVINSLRIMTMIDQSG